MHPASKRTTSSCSWAWSWASPSTTQSCSTSRCRKHCTASSWVRAAPCGTSVTWTPPWDARWGSCWRMTVRSYSIFRCTAAAQQAEGLCGRTELVAKRVSPSACRRRACRAGVLPEFHRCSAGRGRSGHCRPVRRRRGSHGHGGESQGVRGAVHQLCPELLSAPPGKASSAIMDFCRVFQGLLPTANHMPVRSLRRLLAAS